MGELEKDRKNMYMFRSCLNYDCTHKPVFDSPLFENARLFNFLV